MKLEKSSLQYVIDNKDVLTNYNKDVLKNDLILKILRQIVDAMSFIYLKLKMSHNNLKLANILKIDDDYNIKISEFGASRIV